MRVALIVAAVTTLALVSDAAGQNNGLNAGTANGLGKVNPFTQQFKRDSTGQPILDPITGLPIPTQPFTGEPSHLNNAYPTQPWNQLGVGRVDYGQLVQYLVVPPENAAITLNVPVPDSVPPQTRVETVEIPGYYVAETTTGYWYPDRWGLQQLNVGVYQWVKLPAEFRKK
jgi:hypothetical protein